MRVLMLYSGGIFGTAIIRSMLDIGTEVDALFIRYGQASEDREYAAASRFAKLWDFNILQLRLEFLRHLRIHAVNAGVQAAYPPISQMTEEMVADPIKNMLFISAAAKVAAEMKIDAVASGIPYYTGMIYLVNAIYNGSQGKLRLLTDWTEESKSHALKRAWGYDIPLQWTWSCLDGEDSAYHCGICVACRRRKSAFAEAGIEDPTSYLQ